MIDALEHYRQLERRLWLARWKHTGEESNEEDAILDEMDEVWYELSEEQRDLLRAEGPTCWPMDGSVVPPASAGSRSLAVPTAWTYDGFRSTQETILSMEANP